MPEGPRVAGSLIVGCGYVGQRLAAALREAGGSPIGLVRSTESATVLRAAGIPACIADLAEPSSLSCLPSLTHETRVYYLAPPPGAGVDDPWLAAFLAALRDKPGRVIYLSTSGVYGDCKGAWVDETHPVQPHTDRARRRWSAECRLREWGVATQVPAVILRVGGIYGPGRLPIERLRRGLTVICPEDAPYSNRIHVDDLVTSLVAAGERGRAGEVYNVADGQPTTMTDFFNRVADFAKLPRPVCVRLAEAPGQISAAMLSYVSESRRMRIEKLKQELGVTMRYPELDDGFSSCDAELK